MEKYIATRKTNPRGYPIQRTTFTDYKCQAIHTGLRDCAMHQPEWPVELDQGTHCNRLLHFVNETYFQDHTVTDSVTEAMTTTPSSMTTGEAAIGDERNFEGSMSDTEMVSEHNESIYEEGSHGRGKEVDKGVSVEKGNIFYFILGFILGMLFYVVAVRILKIALGLSPVLNIQSGSNSSAAFFYVSTTPTTILKEMTKPLLPVTSTYTSKSVPIVTGYGDNTV